MYTNSKIASVASNQQLNCGEKSNRAKKENAIDGLYMDRDMQSLQYEDAVNALLFGYSSNFNKKIGGSRYLNGIQPNSNLYDTLVAIPLQLPIHTVYLARQLQKTSIRKNQKPKAKAYTSNPFL